MTFLPKDYEQPKTPSSYYKFEDGQNRFRVMSSAIIGWEYFTEENKPFRYRSANASELPEGAPFPGTNPNNGEQNKPKHFWAFVALDREDNTFKVCEVTQKTVQDAMIEHVENEDYGDPKGYDITVSKKGKGLDTKYTVIASPPKEISKEISDAYGKIEIDLEKLFTNDSPFRDGDTLAVSVPKEVPTVGNTDVPYPENEFVADEDNPFAD